MSGARILKRLALLASALLVAPVWTAGNAATNAVRVDIGSGRAQVMDEYYESERFFLTAFAEPAIHLAKPYRPAGLTPSQLSGFRDQWSLVPRAGHGLREQAKLAQAHEAAIGLSGAHGNSLAAQKRATEHLLASGGAYVSIDVERQQDPVNQRHLYTVHVPGVAPIATNRAEDIAQIAADLAKGVGVKHAYVAYQGFTPEEKSALTSTFRMKGLVSGPVALSLAPHDSLALQPLPPGAWITVDSMSKTRFLGGAERYVADATVGYPGRSIAIRATCSARYVLDAFLEALSRLFSNPWFTGGISVAALVDQARQDVKERLQLTDDQVNDLVVYNADGTRFGQSTPEIDSSWSSWAALGLASTTCDLATDD